MLVTEKKAIQDTIEHVVLIEYRVGERRDLRTSPRGRRAQESDAHPATISSFDLRTWILAGARIALISSLRPADSLRIQVASPWRVGIRNELHWLANRGADFSWPYHVSLYRYAAPRCRRIMTLAPGMRIGKFEVLEPVGVGGMGEVWKARDMVLQRDVALKVLAETNRFDAEALARIKREALLLASLNHPNIATLHGLETVGEAQVLVMELVDGETLEDRIAHVRHGRGLALDDALDIAEQIAAALDDAHQRDIVHRDLKPANVKIREDGTVKVLDFGIAKVLAGESGGPAKETVTSQADAVVGTPSYMSPEQAVGSSVDRKTDVWAFGCVLYEMLTGQRAFDGDSNSRILARVIEREPDWNPLARDVPERIRRLLRQCLEKDPRKRRRDIGDIRLDLEQARKDPIAQTPPSPRSATKMVLPWAAMAAILAAVFTWSLRPPPETEPPGEKRTSILLPADQVLTQQAVGGIAISRDGKNVAYIANNQIYVYDMSAGVARALPGTAGKDISTPVFSPDGEFLVFYELHSLDDATLKRVPLAGGGTLRSLWEGPAPLSISWPTDDEILFVTIAGDAILRIPADGGDEEVLLSARDGEFLESPQLLPDGRLLFTSRPTGASWDGARIYIEAIDSQERTLVRDGGSDAMWISSGHIIYANRNELFVGRWDLDRREPMREVFPVVRGVQRGINSDTAQYSLSDEGTLVYVAGRNAGTRTRRFSLVLVKGARETPLPIAADEFVMVRISPDQQRAAAVVGTPGDIWVYNLDNGTGRQLTFDEDADEVYPFWVSDDELWFFSSREDRPGIYSIPAAGGRAVFVNGGSAIPESMSPDGDSLLAGHIGTDGQSSIALLDLLANPPELEVLIEGNSFIADPAFAPNGHWLAAAASPPAGGPSQIELFPFPDVGRTRVPVWRSPSAQRHPVFVGNQLLFQIKDQGIYSVDVIFDESELAIGQDVQPLTTRRFWYEVNRGSGAGGRAWDVFADGTLLMISFDEDAASGENGVYPLRDQINVVTSWLTELTEGAPGP
jgi:serine/threonine protein kinase/Tol biopolymer transport system component